MPQDILMNQKLEKAIGKIVNTVTSSVAQTKVKPTKEEGWIPPEMSDTARLAAAEGIVMLRNDQNILPFQNDITFYYISYGNYFA